MFPYKTYEQMIDIVKDLPDCEFKQKLLYIDKIKDIDKKNRWFGYYQHGGEIMGLWTKAWVIEEVREEKRLHMIKFNEELHKKRIFKSY